MALLKCPECKSNVSEQASTCIHCGYPLQKKTNSKIVRIKMPVIVLGLLGLFSSRNASVSDEKGNILWNGKHGENAKFEIQCQTAITINLGGWVNPIYCTVEPGCKYSLIQDLGTHLFETYTLSEVDYIDSD